jgi:mannose-6-phosphate isomerase-like protein (cupin superfamily)
MHMGGSVRLLVTGASANGRSYLAEERQLSGENVAPGTAILNLFRSEEGPLAPLPSGQGAYIQDRLRPGQVSWRIIERAGADKPASVTLRHRNTIELAVVLSGDGELVLGDGPHHIGAGDCIILPGVDHALCPGPSGCRLMAFDIGTPAPTAR